MGYVGLTSGTVSPSSPTSAVLAPSSGGYFLEMPQRFRGFEADRFSQLHQLYHIEAPLSGLHQRHVRLISAQALGKLHLGQAMLLALVVIAVVRARRRSNDPWDFEFLRDDWEQ